MHPSINLDQNMEAIAKERKVSVMSEPCPNASNFNYIFCRWMCRWNMNQWHHMGWKLECVLHSGKDVRPHPEGVREALTG